MSGPEVDDLIAFKPEVLNALTRERTWSHGSNCSEGYTGKFEGPEKTLEVCFAPGVGHAQGCRALSREALDSILSEARCTIISKTSNAYLDSYVLSESSLFVYPFKVVIKTCGRTTLLRCLRRLLEYTTGSTSCETSQQQRSPSQLAFSSSSRDGAPEESPKVGFFASDEDDEEDVNVVSSDDERERTRSATSSAFLGLRLEWVGYSRKNYAFPDEQPSPHTSFGEELAYLREHSDASYGGAFDGNGYVLGPITGDHWFVYVADECERPSSASTERTINIMMFDLADDVRDAFYVHDGESDDLAATAKKMTARSGLGKLLVTSRSVSVDNESKHVDACAFEPCGYSMNALCFESYTTVHVTPEASCSYASFETNTALKSYASLVKNVLAVFKPRRAVLTLFADEAGLAHMPRQATFDGLPRLDVGQLGTYTRNNYSCLHLESDSVAMMANYQLATPRSKALALKRFNATAADNLKKASSNNLHMHMHRVGSLQ